MPEFTPAFSLRNRLLLLLLVPLLLLLAISGFVSYRIALRYANSVYDGWLYDSVNSLAQALETSTSGTLLDLPGSAQRLFEWDVEDKTFYSVSSRRRGLIGGRADLPPPSPVAETYQQASIYDAVLDGQPVRVVALTLTREVNEVVLLQVAETERKRHGLARQILLTSLLPQLLLVVVAAAVLWFGIRSGLSPLRAVTREISAQTHRSFQRMPESGAPAEVRPLIHALNDLLDRLERALTSQRAFVADAAHQLRTPLATLKLQVDEALATPAPDETRRMLERLRGSTNRLVRLSGQLLSLARAEPDAVEAQAMERLDLRALAQEAGADWVPQALAKGLDLTFDTDALDVAVIGNAVLLREALNNLLDNAIKHHPGDGRISMSVTASDGPHITIEDDGPGIPLEQRNDSFRRFRRGDRGTTEGAGLGLAIVAEIIALHGGTVALKDGASGRGLRVDVRLPSPG